MDTVQLENLLLVLSPIVFGFFPALLDVISLKRKPPNMLIALLVAISSLAWTPSRLDILVVVFGLINVPAVPMLTA